MEMHGPPFAAYTPPRGGGGKRRDVSGMRARGAAGGAAARSTPRSSPQIYSSLPRPLPFHFLEKRRLRRNFGSMPFIVRRCPLPSAIGFLMPFRWFLYDWLCAVWLVDFAIAAAAGGGAAAVLGRRSG